MDRQRLLKRRRPARIIAVSSIYVTVGNDLFIIAPNKKWMGYARYSLTSLVGAHFKW